MPHQLDNACELVMVFTFLASSKKMVKFICGVELKLELSFLRKEESNPN